MSEQHTITQFARRLNELLIQKDMTQADLARTAFGTHTNKKTGYTEATGRDRISAYLAGRTYPEPRTLQKLADALNVKVDDLAPDALAATVDRDNPNFSMNAVAGYGSKTHLVVDLLLPIGVAAQVAALVAPYVDDKGLQ
jgi:transcriptional regulator with XRE-family HTH domain